MDDKPVELPEGMQSGADFEALVRAANSGDELAVKRLRELIHTRPEIWQRFGDLCEYAEVALTKAIAGNNQLVFTSLQKNVQDLRNKLHGPEPSPLEKLLVGRVIVSYLELQFATVRFASDDAKNLVTSKYAIQVKNGAQRRFDAAVKSLMLVRERLPAIERANRELKKDRRKVIQLPKRVSA